MAMEISLSSHSYFTYWRLTVRGGYCVDRRVLYRFSAAFNVVMDMLILGLLP
ncbi:hypothetical protein VTH06DRAFT_3530 [Thermothelomyces fergusii]